MCTLPDFKSPEERHAYFRRHVGFFTAACRLERFTYRSEHETLEDARAAAAAVAKALNKVIMIYAVIGNYDQWLENVKPT
jgi:hypothetical protein